MNKANLKSYAPKARLDFIKAVTERANVLGISAAGAAQAQMRGDVAIIDGREWPAKVARQRGELVARIKRHGFDQTMDEVAYTWFNRFAALRYMEIHDYLGHGWRVLSSRDGGLPEILHHASEVTLPGLNPDRAREMQLAGNQDNELYKLLLVAQCNELSRVMPFLFEHIDDETELLLPENLLRTDSIVVKLVEQVPEEDWQEIEVIGWLYQFYISEKHEQVIGKVVKSEDIPAATQLFTPHWIVQYMVQNSIGRLWLTANPSSTLATQWPYYIQPAEQTPNVQAQLDSLIEMRIRESGETLNPESLTVLDPACGSGHILVVAYDVLKAIYLERGYQPRAIPRLILEKNLFGLDIDYRAGQLAAFALLMKARADDRRLFNEPLKLNVLSLQDSRGLDANELATNLLRFGVQSAPLKAVLDTFEDARTVGSLIDIPSQLSVQLSEMKIRLESALFDGDLYVQQAATDVLPLVRQAIVLATQFDAVVANPPYIASKAMNGKLKQLVEASFKIGKGDLFAAFLIRARDMVKIGGSVSFMTPFTWMFLSSYEPLRNFLIRDLPLTTLIHPEYHSIWDSAAVPICSFSAQRRSHCNSLATFIDLSDVVGADKQAELLSQNAQDTEWNRRFDVPLEDFSVIPRAPFAYSLSERVKQNYRNGNVLDKYCKAKQGIKTGDNEKFLRFWYEVPRERIHFPGDQASKRATAKWFICTKGGDFRRWFGNLDYVLNWANDGADIRGFVDDTGRQRSRPQNIGWFFKEGATWSTITSSLISMRYFPKGCVFESKGSVCFPVERFDSYSLLALMNSSAIGGIIAKISPTIDYSEGAVGSLPVAEFDHALAANLARQCVQISQTDCDSSETSWGFDALWATRCDKRTISDSWNDWNEKTLDRRRRLKEIETDNNRLFSQAYALGDEVSPEVPESQITLIVADRQRDSQRLISYVIGCMMGRYSIGSPGLIYADAGDVGFDSSLYEKRFPAETDGIVPLTDGLWFEDDAATRLREFMCVIWGTATVEENMAWLAESLGAKSSEAPDVTVRRYLADKFFKDHLQTYKKRPIYWLFSSGKQGAFQALVYLHRYNEGTLSRMRAEYVVPLIAKVVSRLDMLDQDVTAASSAAARTKLQKQIESLRKKQIELLAYDEKLRHYADMRITLDLDDGVKVNYAKFDDLVAESKVITGGSDE